MKKLLLILTLCITCSCTPSLPDRLDENPIVQTAEELKQNIAKNDVQFWEYVAASVIGIGTIAFLVGGFFGISKLTSISTIGIGIGIVQIHQIMGTLWFNILIGTFLTLLICDILYIVYIKTREYLLDKKEK